MSFSSSQGKGRPRTCYDAPEGRTGIGLLNLGARWGGWSTSRPGRFTHWKDPVPVVQEAGWVSGPVWTDTENRALSGIRSPDRLARSESLCRLSYPGPLFHPVPM